MPKIPALSSEKIDKEFMRIFIPKKLLPFGINQITIFDSKGPICDRFIYTPYYEKEAFIDYRRLGKSGLKVSEIGLCTNAFGDRTDEQTSVGIINHALELGINFIDTADTYTREQSEEIIGKALKEKRQRVVIASKFGYPGAIDPKNEVGRATI
jgi:hypothetical protein